MSFRAPARITPLKILPRCAARYIFMQSFFFFLSFFFNSFYFNIHSSGFFPPFRYSRLNSPLFLLMIKYVAFLCECKLIYFTGYLFLKACSDRGTSCARTSLSSSPRSLFFFSTKTSKIVYYDRKLIC